MEQEFWAFGTTCDKKKCNHSVLPPRDATVTATLTGITKAWSSRNYSSHTIIGFRDVVFKATVAGTIMGSEILDGVVNIASGTFWAGASAYPEYRPEYQTIYPFVAMYEPYSDDEYYRTLKFTYGSNNVDAPFADVRCQNGVARFRQALFLTQFNIEGNGVGLPLTGATWGATDENGERTFSLTFGPTRWSGSVNKLGLTAPYYETFCNGVEYV
ncbi:MAG: hypothetical protein IKY61_00285 [Thermoguttaceae bacterium]|nr:hypothetical protein [Thermoguttaceae bacterium]